MHPTELHIYDVDGTLYKSPKPPIPDPVWYFHAHSFGMPREPGYDGRWILEVVSRARHSMLDPTVMTVVLTGRPDHGPMQKKVAQLLRLTGLRFDKVQLQPILFAGTTAQYKGLVVAGWLKQLPSVRKVVFYDDEPDNHVTVGGVARELGLKYQGVLTPGS
jgi:hypothetical protein